MSGTAAALAGARNGSTAGTGVHVSPTPAWGSIFGVGIGSTVSQTIAGITAPISVSATLTGGATLLYYLNSNFMAYTGAFTVHAGDTLLWMVEAPDASRHNGTITVKNDSDASAVLGSIPYSIKLDSGI